MATSAPVIIASTSADSLVNVVYSSQIISVIKDAATDNIVLHYDGDDEVTFTSVTATGTKDVLAAGVIGNNLQIMWADAGSVYHMRWDLSTDSVNKAPVVEFSGSRPSLIVDGDDRIICHYVTSGGEHGSRVSEDEGDTWSSEALIDASTDVEDVDVQHSLLDATSATWIHQRSSDAYVGAQEIDYTSPTVTNRSPAPLDVDVAVDTDISFTTTDDASGAGVDQTSINVNVDTVPVIVSGIFQAGYTGTIVVNGNGFDVTVDPDVNLLINSNVNVEVEVSDQASPANTTNVSWSFSTEEGITEAPKLTSSPGNGSIQLRWTLPPPTQMLQELFQLVKSTQGFPTSVSEGEIVYEGLARDYLDEDVVNGQRYYYTIFVIRKFVSDQPEYVPYEQKSSTTAVPRAISVGTIVLDEYEPERGEFGVTADPIPHGTLQKTWGRLEGGVRIQNDIFSVRSGREVLSPLRGRVLDTGEISSSSPSLRLYYVEVVNDRGLVVRLSGFAPLSNVSIGQALIAGQIVGRTSSSEIIISCFKQPVAKFGRRSVNPRNFFLTKESRDGSR